MRLAIAAVAMLLPSQFKAIVAGATREMSACTECAEAVTVISDYVATHKHWRKFDYRIEKQADEGDRWIYHVVYLPDLRNAVRGGGESFWIYYNPTTRAIVQVINSREVKAGGG